MGELLLCPSVGVAEDGQRVGQFERVQVTPHPVLNDLLHKDLVLLGRLHPTRHFRKASLFGSREAAFPGDNPIAAGGLDVTDRNRLQDAVAANRLGEFVEIARVDPFTWLFGIGLDVVNIDQEGPRQSTPAFHRALRGTGRLVKRQLAALSERLRSGFQRGRCRAF